MYCQEAYLWIEKASVKGYPTAKRTIGFLYTFADNREVLKANEYDECKFERNVFSGTKMLKEAKAEGDSVAAVLLKQLGME